MPALLAGSIFGLSLLLILLRPRHVPDWAAALAGGFALLLVGVLPPAAALNQLAANWNIFLFFLGLGVVAATADDAGVFRWAAEVALQRSKGSQRRLLIGVYVVGALVTCVLSNDATALLLTPVVFAVATRAGLDPRPYAFGCALVANAASFLLPVSNPSNLLILARAPLPLAVFVRELWLPSLAALVVTLLGLLLTFRGELALPFTVSTDKSPLDRRTIRAGIGVMALAGAYVLAAAQGWPLGVVSVLGGMALLALNWRPRQILREVPWAILPLFAGLLLLVTAGEVTGLFTPLSVLLGTGPLLLAPALALLANVINNLPTALVVASSLGNLSAGTTRDQLAAATIVGVNLGPNLTTVGSLATMLWLLLLRRRGLDVSLLSYLRIGGAITLPALAAAVLALWVTLR